MTTKQKRYGIDVIAIYLSQIKEFPRLSLEEERDLVEKAKTDEKAREKLLLSTLWVVPAIANKFIGSRLDYIDLIGEGNYGLLKAINSLDKFQGRSRFSTYAGESVFHTIASYLRKERKQTRLKIENLSELVDNTSNPSEISEKNEILENLEAAVEKLSPAEKSFLKALFFEDKTVHQLAHSNNRAKLFLYRKKNRIMDKLRPVTAA